jgi:hypothetical protein
MYKIKSGETTYDVRTVIVIRDCDATLDKIFREGTGKADGFIISFDTQEDVTKYEDRRAEGYEPLCLILTDGRTMYPVKPEHRDVAEKVASEIDNRPMPRMKIN